MKQDNPVSDEQLNSLLDNELENEERALVFEAIQNDKAVSARYCELRQVKDLVTLAYQDPPTPIHNKHLPNTTYSKNWLNSAVASFLLLIMGGTSGWIMNEQLAGNDTQVPASTFQTIEDFRPETVKTGKVLLHIDSMDATRVNNVLDTTVRLLDISESKHEPLDLEVVANAEGLGLLRDGSPYAERIIKIMSEHSNVKFMACGIAKKTLALKEGHDIDLIPEAQDIPAALDQILYRVKEGWTYVRG